MTKKKQPSVTTISLSALHANADEEWNDYNDDLPTYNEADLLKLNPDYFNSLSTAGSSFSGQSSLPNKPPFTAYVGNLAREVSEVELTAFFENTLRCRLVSCKLASSREASRKKAFGYVTFAHRNELASALQLSGMPFFNNSIKIDVASLSQSGETFRGGLSGPGASSRGSYRDRDYEGRTSAADSDNAWRTRASRPESSESSSFSSSARTRSFAQAANPSISQQPAVSTTKTSNFNHAPTNNDSRPRVNPFADATFFDKPSGSRPLAEVPVTSAPQPPAKKALSYDPFGGSSPVDINYESLAASAANTNSVVVTVKKPLVAPISNGEPSSKEAVVLPAKPKSDPFGGAHAVDTSKIYVEGSTEATPLANQDEKPRPKRFSNVSEEQFVYDKLSHIAPAPPLDTTKPRHSNPFGEAKPVDTAKVLRQVEEKILEKSVRVAKTTIPLSKSGKSLPGDEDNVTEDVLVKADNQTAADGEQLDVPPGFDASATSVIADSGPSSKQADAVSNAFTDSAHTCSVDGTEAHGMAAAAAAAAAADAAAAAADNSSSSVRKPADFRSKFLEPPSEPRIPRADPFCNIAPKDTASALKIVEDKQFQSLLAATTSNHRRHSRPQNSQTHSSAHAQGSEAHSDGHQPQQQHYYHQHQQGHYSGSRYNERQHEGNGYRQRRISGRNDSSRSQQRSAGNEGKHDGASAASAETNVAVPEGAVGGALTSSTETSQTANGSTSYTQREQNSSAITERISNDRGDRNRERSGHFSNRGNNDCAPHHGERHSNRSEIYHRGGHNDSSYSAQTTAVNEQNFPADLHGQVRTAENKSGGFNNSVSSEKSSNANSFRNSRSFRKNGLQRSFQGGQEEASSGPTGNQQFGYQRNGKGAVEGNYSNAAGSRASRDSIPNASNNAPEQSYDENSVVSPQESIKSQNSNGKDADGFLHVSKRKKNRAGVRGGN